MFVKNSYPPASWQLFCLALVLSLDLSARALPAAEVKSASFEATGDGRYRIIPHPKIGPTPATSSTSSGGWWLGSAGIAVALAVFGGVAMAAKKLKPHSEIGPLKVLSRTNLSPRHSIYLLKAGDRVFIIGTGPQGAPSLLGEMERDEQVEARPPSTNLAASLLSTARHRVGGGV